MTYVISSIEFTSPDGTYKLGDAIDIRVTTSHSIDDGSLPVYTHDLTHTSIELDIGPPAAHRHAVFRNVPGALDPPVTVMDYRYTVQVGDTSNDLDYTSTTSLHWGSGVTEGHSGEYRHYNCALPAPRGAGSLSDERMIRVDGIVPRVTNVISPTSDGTYTTGDTITVTVNFTEPVVVGAGPEPSLMLALDSGPTRTRTATYVPGGSTDRSLLNFTYTVQPNDGTSDLAYNSPASLTGNITDVAGNTANLALPPRGQPGSLAHSSNIAVRDTSGPRVVNVTAVTPDGVYRQNNPITITVNFDEPVVYSDAESIALYLNVGGERRQADRYLPNNGSATLVFSYSVKAGDMAADLDYYDAMSLAVGSTNNIRDTARNLGNRELPAPGAEGSLAHTSNILLDYAAPPLVAKESAIDAGPSIAEDGFNLGGLYNVAAFELGGAAYVLATSASDNGVQLIRVNENGTLSPAGFAQNGTRGFDMIDAGFDIAAFEMNGGEQYAIVTDPRNHGVQLIRIHENGTMKAISSATDGMNGFEELEGALGIDVFEMNGGAYAIVSSLNDNGVQLIRIHGNGMLQANGSAINGAAGFDGDFELDRPWQVDAFEMNGGAYAMVTSSHADNGVLLVRIHENGTIKANSSAIDGMNGFEVLDEPRGVAVFEMDGDMYALAASAADNGVQLIRIHENGTLKPSGSATHDDAGFDELAGTEVVTAFSIGGIPHALATSTVGDGVQLIRILPDGTLLRAGSATHDDAGFDALDGAVGVDTIVLDNRTYAAVAAAADNGVQLIRLSPPFVAKVASATPDGAYRAGRTVGIDVVFSEAVRHIGPPPLLVLNVSGAQRDAPYASGSGTASLRFNYTVRANDNVDDLDYHNRTALSGFVETAERIAANLTLPAPGALGSLASSSDIALDTARPSVVNVTSATLDGPYGQGRQIDISVNFDEPVMYTGNDPTLALNTGGAAAYASGNGTASLNFTYTVRAVDNAARLDYSATTALSGAIADLAGNAADRTLYSPGSEESLGGASAIAVDGVPPAVASVSSATPDGAYGAGAAINITVAFGERVAYAGDPPPRLALNVAGDSPRTANYTSGNKHHVAQLYLHGAGRRQRG